MHTDPARLSRSPSHDTADSANSRWVQFNRALARSTAVACRPGLQGRWKSSDRVVIATGC